MHVDVYRGEFAGRGSSPWRFRLGCAAGTDDRHETKNQHDTGCGSCPHTNRLTSRTSGLLALAHI